MALELAKRGKGKVEPNPLVGAVVIKDGKVVGRGWHEYFGGPHAEVNALLDAGKKAEGANLYVTLEPCSQWGKTPPCTEKILRYHIKSVFCSMSDVNPKNMFKGIGFLRKNGVKVINNILKENAFKLNKEYVDSFKNKSQVIVKYAMSLDGKISTRLGDSKWITNAISRQFVHKLRNKMDAVIVGIGTVLNDNPLLTSHGTGKNPVRVIVDPRLKIPVGSNVLGHEAATIIFYSEPNNTKMIKLKKKAILIKLPAKKGLISFKSIINKLSEISIRKVLIEGGGETIAAALGSGYVDEIYAFIAPIVIGGRDAKTPVEGLGIARIMDALKLKSYTLQKYGQDILIKGKINRCLPE